ncbi:MAG: ABC-three component system protein [Thermoplasmatota archaeon]
MSISGDRLAGPSALGYLYQSRKALLLLLESSQDAQISIEKFDDIAFETKGEATELIQTKHHIKNTGSLSNAGDDLWRTLGAWANEICESKAPVSDVARTIVTTGFAPQGSAAEKLRPVAPGRDVLGAWKLLAKTAQESKSESNKRHYAAWKKLDESIQQRLVDSVRILDSSPNILDSKEEILGKMRLGVREKHLPLLYERLEGWWFGRVVDHLMGSSKAPISFRELNSRIIDLKEQFQSESLPIDFGEVAIPDVGALSSEQRTFVRQVELVMAGSTRLQKAVGDYYRAFQQRSRWISEDLLLVGELEKYEDRLVDEWERHFSRVNEGATETAEEDLVKRGRQVYDWMELDCNLTIRPKVTEAYVMRGTYHVLANKLRVGWHPNFVTRLSVVIAKAAPA